MFEVVAKLLLHRQIAFEKGKISIFGRPSSLLPTDSLVNIQKELEKRGLVNIIYYNEKTAGFEWFKQMNKDYRLKGTDVIKWGSDIVTLAGWGEAIILERDDSNKQILFELRNSTVTQYYSKKNPVAVDNFFRGLLAGAMSFIYQDDLDCIEVNCVSKGDPICKFVVKRKDQFIDSDIVRGQLELPK